MRAVAVLIACWCGLGIAHAQEKPWAEGVPAQSQQDALAIYQRANAAFEQAHYKEALVEYEQALTLWDHPAIRYNAAVCLINLDRPVEAYEHLLAALRFGEPPLGRELYAQGMTYKKMLANQVAELEIVLDEPGAKVSLDGKHLFDAPSSATQFVEAAQEHQIVAEKPGYETKTETIKLAPGKHTIVLRLEPLAAPRRLERRWDKWKPLAVLAGGGAIAAFGGVMYWQSRSHYADYDAAVRLECPQGCMKSVLMPSTRELETSARREKIIAYSGLVVGGTAMAAGLTMVLLNQPRLVAPVAGGDRVGVVLTGRW